MPAQNFDLGVLQRWMQAVLMHPAGVDAGVGSPAARAEIDIDPDHLERVITRSRALPAADRLAVYGNAYFARLLECLREEYPALAHALGADLFDEFAMGYLEAYPSRSYTLHQLGANFPRYLAETCPPDEDPGWAAFLIDLATLERIFSEVFDGPGVEGQPLLSADRLAAIAPDHWPDARLVPAAGLRLVELRVPVHEYIHAVKKRRADPPPPAPAETLLAVHRRDYVVRRRPLLRPQYELLQALVAGESMADAIGRAAVAGADLDALASDLPQWFRAWAAEGFFQDVVTGTLG